MRSKKNNITAIQDNGVVLEQLESRILLNGASPTPSLYFENEDAIIDSEASNKLFNELDQALSGHNDGLNHNGIFNFFSDPTTWDLTPLLGKEINATTNELVDFVSDMIDNYDEINTLLATDNDISIIETDTPYTSTALTSSATNILYLNFQADIVTPRSSDGWLYSYNPIAPGFDLAKYDWGGQENDAIEHIVNFVAEDYAPYNIAVTTQQPTSGHYTTIFVGGDNDWYDANSHVIGIASYDPGNRRDSNYGFAFTDELSIYANRSETIQDFSEYIANLVTHEAAHALGANHLNDITALMNPYLPTKPQSSSFGENFIPNSSQYQDTQKLIGANIGFKNSYNDDYLNTTMIQMNTSLDGILERRDDSDQFSFISENDGEITVAISTNNYSNLDAYLSIYQKNNMTLITEIDNTEGTTDPIISFIGNKGVEYVIEVSSAMENYSGSYHLELTDTAIIPNSGSRIVVTDTSGDSDDLRLIFENTLIGETTSSSIMIENSGDEPLNITDIITSAGFIIDPSITLPLIINTDATSTIPVYFSPNYGTHYNSTITILSNAQYNSTVTINVSGSGKTASPNLLFVSDTENKYTIDNLIVNETISYPIVVENTGEATLNIYDILYYGDFEVTLPKNSFFSIAPGAIETIMIDVTATTRGDSEGSLTFISNNEGMLNTNLLLSAQVLGGELSILLDDQDIINRNITFNDIMLNKLTTTIIALSNSGDAPLTISAITTTGVFSLGDTLLQNNVFDDIVLSPNEFYNIEVSTTPATIDSLQDTLTITSGDTTFSETNIDLNADVKGGVLSIEEVDGNNDGIYNFNERAANIKHTLPIWKLTNNGNIPITLFFSMENNVSFNLDKITSVTIGAGYAYTLNATLDTKLAHHVHDVLTVTSNDTYETTKSIDLNGDSYAKVKKGNSYKFRNGDGEKITVSLSGPGKAKVVTGLSENDGDIKSISVTSSTTETKLSIKSKQEATVGEINSTNSIGKISASKTTLINSGISIDGYLKTLKLFNLNNDADIAFDAYKNTTLSLNNVDTTGDIEVSGHIKTFNANNFDNGDLTANSFGKIKIAEDFKGSIKTISGDIKKLLIKKGTLSGNIESTGDIKEITVSKGDLTGSVNSNNNIERIYVNKGTVSGNLFAQNNIDLIKTYNLVGSNIEANNIVKINVKSTTIDNIFTSSNTPLLSTLNIDEMFKKDLGPR